MKKGGCKPKKLLNMRYVHSQKSLEGRTKATLTSSDVNETNQLSPINPIFCTDASNKLIEESVTKLQYIQEIDSVRKEKKKKKRERENGEEREEEEVKEEYEQKGSEEQESAKQRSI